MGALDELHHLCRRRGFRLRLFLLDHTSARVRSEPIGHHGSLALRVLVAPDEVYGRCQSEPGLESIDELAAGVLDVLGAKGLV